MSDPQSGDPVDEFRAAVATAFGTPWRVERTADGFVAAMPVRAPLDGDGVTGADEVRVTVEADPATRRYRWSSRRVAGLDRDVSSRSLTGYRRDVETNRYSGLRRTWNFRRTPEGLVPNPAAPDDSAGREADLRRVAGELGWTEDPSSRGGVDLAAALPPTRMLLLVGVVFGVVLLFIGGVAAFVIANVLGALAP